MAKKMCSKFSDASTGHMLGFTYPVLHKTKKSGAYVDYYALDPARGEFRRKKHVISGSAKEIKTRANELIGSILKKLRSGWNPFVNTGDSRGYIPLEDVFDRYLRYVKTFDRRKTTLSYSSRVNVFKEFLKTRVVNVHYAYQVDRELIIDFLDWLLLDRDVSARTRNNYKGWCSSFCGFMVERRYISENPCDGIAAMKETRKIRQPLTPAMLAELHAHLSLVDKPFLLACLMEYYTFIRPTELSFAKVGDVSVINRKISVDGAVSKNRNDGAVALNDTILRLMIELEVLNKPGEFYLFGKGFRPSAVRMGPDQFNKRWAKMRAALGWSKVYQFYSLKDTGIRDLANAKGIVIARDQARHSDVSTTNKYLKGKDSPVHPEAQQFKGGL